ncbi:molybdopterin molybdotransferase MoeA [Pantoea sp. Aalb]|uniref:molybdopterin molybdotransferase MoeA n=1 Tax=Pantoea sp. Aalb TaxID=2576762 RepID=UPI00132170B0|nr:molybdopterin molybdotransferase MoeA [Pantoea sp. Aalb]MXP67505.1 molybdopterin molybdotransferase MoeA [Pantoea sp. Aalb]
MQFLTTKLISFEEAQQKIYEQIQPINDHIKISLLKAAGYITAKAVFSPLDLPLFDNSAMDGYAIQQIKNIKLNHLMQIIGIAYAGKPFENKWPPDTVIRIMTGAPIPNKCDAVIMQENIQKFGNKISINTPIYKGQNIRYKGEDIQIGNQILDSGIRLDSTELTLLASLGINKVSVIRKLRVAIFSTGNELQILGKPLLKNQIYDINRFIISLMLNKLNCKIIDLGIIRDHPNEIRYIFNKADRLADIVICTGGISVGDTDFTRMILQEIGDITFYKLAIKPGKPFAFGRLKNSWFCSLPGNPVSATVTFYYLVQPILKHLAGNTKYTMPLRQRAITMNYLKKTPGRLDFQRGVYSQDENGLLKVSSTGIQDSHIFRSLTMANCFIILERERGNVNPGEWVEIEGFNRLLKG